MALLFMLSFFLLCKHCFLALAAVLLFLLPCSLYFSLRDAYLGKLRILPAFLPEPFSNYFILLLYKHFSWQGVYSLNVSCSELVTVNIYKRDKHLFL
jgi:hypothetical protein